MLLSCASSLQKKLGSRQQAAAREGHSTYVTRSLYNAEYRNWLRSVRNQVRHGVRNAAAQVCLLFVEWVLFRITRLYTR
jgi:hypothetical protein